MPWRTELLIIEVTDGARDVASVLFVLPQPLQYIQMALEEGYLYKHSTFLHQVSFRILVAITQAPPNVVEQRDCGGKTVYGSFQ